MLDSFLNENGKGLIKIFIISLQKNEGNVVCLCPSKIHLPRAVTLFDQQFKILYVLKCRRVPILGETHFYVNVTFRKSTISTYVLINFYMRKQYKVLISLPFVMFNYGALSSNIISLNI